LVLVLGFSGCGEDNPGTEEPDTDNPGGDNPGGKEPDTPAPPPYVATGKPVDDVAEITSGSIKEKFEGSKDKTGTAGVDAAFKELSAFIQESGLTDAETENLIKLGDWIDLDGGLEIAPYGDIGFKSGDNWNTPLSDSKGKLSRLIVVGINSFQSSSQPGYQYPDGEGKPPAHVVFQFQNIPHRHRMSAKNGGSSEGGYPASEMREYLTGYFLAGLITAGVPDEVLWPPVRMVSTRIQSSDEEGNFLAQIKVKLWLPTAWEIAGSKLNDVPDEMVNNQTQLAYYKSEGSRVKYDTSNTAARYWLASTTTANDSAFVVVDSNGNMLTDGDVSASDELGVAPAFCVQGWQ
jgi:hypothetical protein